MTNCVRQPQKAHGMIVWGAIIVVQVARYMRKVVLWLSAAHTHTQSKRVCGG
jgi:hypothetical protein